MRENESTYYEIAIPKGEEGDTHAQIWRILVPLLVTAVVYMSLARMPFLINGDYVEPQVLLIKLGLFSQEITWEKTHAEIQAFEAEDFKDSIML